MPVIGTCKLCCTRNVRLCLSHYMPKSAYRIQTTLGGSIGINAKTAVLQPKQVADCILCLQCEQRFRQNGEDWVMSHCYRGDRFRLREMLLPAIPVIQQPGLNWFSAKRIP